VLPVDGPTLLAFAVPAVATVMSPGPDTVLILRYALGSGQKVGFAAVAGVQLGLVGHTLLAAAGISVIVATSPLLFTAITIAGAAYLAWIGWQGLRGVGALAIAGRAQVGAAKALRDALFCNLLNPKVILLFLALFPQFVDARRDDVPAQLATLAALLLLINVAWQAPMAWAAQAARRWLDRPAVQLAVARTTGVVFIVFAVLLLAEHLL
jgi:threonine/homoserine/homoserine lactone efflux protein